MISSATAIKRCMTRSQDVDEEETKDNSFTCANAIVLTYATDSHTMTLCLLPRLA